ncbi:MAG: hypothetical protein ACXQS7_04770 [Candidatus Syntropharchaeia archaeon]
MFPRRDDVEGIFGEICEKLEVDGKEMKDLVVYLMTDGTRTSTDLDGWEAYFDGGFFSLRVIHFLRLFGAKNCYVNVIHERHKFRENYEDIYEALRRLVDVYGNYAMENGVRLRFIGDYTERINPEGTTHDLREDLRRLEEVTSTNDKFTAHFLINYSTKWAAGEGKKIMEELPEANVIIRHAKGYVNGDMWLYKKLDNNSFLYAQNGSSSINWSDREILCLIALALRSFILNRGTHYSKSYTEKEKEEIKRKREKELYFVHRKLVQKPKKRVVIFSSFGPEIYEF